MLCEVTKVTMSNRGSVPATIWNMAATRFATGKTLGGNASLFSKPPLPAIEDNAIEVDCEKKFNTLSAVKHAKT